jgi:hypothetical protein
MVLIQRNLLEKLSIAGTLIFSGLYIYSANLYPGGSQADLKSIGFDWVNNYWCDLLNALAMNGQINSARPVAITAMIILCASMSLFFIQFGRKLATSSITKIGIQFGGVISMIFAAFIFTGYHDLMTTLSSVLGGVAVVGIIREVYISAMTFFKWTGVLNIVLLVLNNCIYYSTYLIEYLPLIQKITFVVVLLWIIGLNIKLIKKVDTN